ncbi:MAG: hypothetical protein QXZ09_08600 [Candidatus Methanomethylicaceae archaeon]
MPIAPYRHNLKTQSGEPVFIVKSPRPVTRTLLGVKFYMGEGRTRYEEKAMRFDEEFGYTIILPEGHPGWTLASPTPTYRGVNVYEPDGPYSVDNTDVDEEIEVVVSGDDSSVEEPYDLVPPKRGRKGARNE